MVPTYVAEFLVNHTETLPQHYTMYAFWEAFRAEFARFKERDSLKPVEDSAASLLQISETLKLDLEAKRRGMVREYDIPAAPMEVPNARPDSTFTRFR